MPSFVKPIVIICLSICGVAYAHAEEPEGKGEVLRLGGFLGGGFVDWMGKDADGMVPGETAVAKQGFSAGLVVPIDLSTLLQLGIEPVHVAVQSELAYATRGTELVLDGESRSPSVNLAYLQAGLLLRAEYSTAGKATPYLVLGSELGFLLSAEYENSRGGTSDVEDNFKSTDLGLILGVGAMYALPPYGSLGLELRGDLGLVSIDGQGDGDEIRNAALTLLLVYLY